MRVNRGVLLEYVISEKGRESNPERITVINGLTTPTNANGIAKLLEHVRWYRELIPDFAKIAVLFIQMFRKDCKFEWTEACQMAFEELRNKLSTYLVLRPPD